MKIRIHSDYVCPFCYLGKEIIRQSLENTGIKADIEFVPHELRRPPSEPVDPMHDEMRLTRFEEVIKPWATDLGLEMSLPFISPHPFTTLAFQGYYFAEDVNLGALYNEKVFHAFYVQEKNIGDFDVLAEIISEIGLDASDFKASVENQTYMPKLDDLFLNREAIEFSSIPAVFLNDTLLPNLESVEEFTQQLLAASK